MDGSSENLERLSPQERAFFDAVAQLCAKHDPQKLAAPLRVEDVALVWRSLWELATDLAARHMQPTNRATRPPTSASRTDFSLTTTTNSSSSNVPTKERTSSVKVTLIPHFLAVTFTASGSSLSSIPPVTVEVHKQFQQDFQARQRTSRWAPSGTTRVLELSAREVSQRLQFLLGRAVDVGLIAKSIMNCVGQCASKSATMQAVMMAAGNDKLRLRCGPLGKLNVSLHSIEFQSVEVRPNKSSAMQSTAGSRPVSRAAGEGAAASSAATKASEMGGLSGPLSGLPPMAVRLGPKPDTTIAAPQNDASLKQPQVPSQEETQATIDDAPELRRLSISRASSRASSSRAGDGSARPYSSCSIGPSVSEAGAIRLAAGSPAMWRRQRLDEELEVVQRQLEARLGVAHTPVMMSSSASQRGESSNGRLSGSLNSGGGGSRLAAFAFRENPNTGIVCLRQPTNESVSHVMGLAVQRHEDELKRIEMQEVRLAHEQGREDEAGLAARAISELKKHTAACDLRRVLQQQQEAHRQVRKEVTQPNVMRPKDLSPFMESALQGGGYSSNQTKQEARQKAVLYKELLDQQRVDDARWREQRHRAEEAVNAEVVELEMQRIATEKSQFHDRQAASKMNYLEVWDQQRNLASTQLL